MFTYNLFVCNDKTIILASSVCDGEKHCWQNEDEQYCKQFVNIRPHLEFCNINLPEGLDESNCQLLNKTKYKESSKMPCVQAPTNLSSLTFDFVSKDKNDK